MDPDQRKKALQTPVSQEEQQRKQALHSAVAGNTETAFRIAAGQGLINPGTPGMYDLSEEQITALSLYTAVDENIIPLPGTMRFLDTFCKHSASRERQGRKELVELATPHPISPMFWPRTGEETQAKQSGGLMSKLGGFFKKPQRGENINDAKPNGQ